MPALTSFSIGVSTTQHITESYPNATSLFIGNASALDTVQLGANAFPQGQHLTLRGTHLILASQTDLPRLNWMAVGANCFNGDVHDGVLLLQSGFFLFSSHPDTPSLRTFSIASGTSSSFNNFATVQVDGESSPLLSPPASLNPTGWAWTTKCFRFVSSPSKNAQVNAKIMERSLRLPDSYCLSSTKKSITTISSTITEIVVCTDFAGSPSQTVFAVESKPRLKQLVVENSALPWVLSLQVANNPCLQRIRLGRNCFACTGGKGALTVKGCRQLEEFSMGPYCFVAVSVMTFCDLAALSDFAFNPTSLQSCESIAFTRCAQLNQIAFPPHSFPSIAAITISDMAELQTIVFGEDSCCGVKSKNPAFSCTSVFADCSSRLECPSLRLIDFGDNINSLSLTSFFSFTIARTAQLGH